jgi:hypothetical protein
MSSSFVPPLKTRTKSPLKYARAGAVVEAPFGICALAVVQSTPFVEVA